MIETKFGNYDMIKNYREAFDILQFEMKYIEECFDKYKYIVGDVSSGILRLKGFSENSKDKNYFKNIPDYLAESVGMNYPYYILKRL